jgi:hypothetical protein
MSVTKGWWIAWSSEVPRKSGVFIIEIVEKAKQNVIQEQFSNIKEKFSRATSFGISNDISNIDADSVLSPGDSFRLRSMKFPDYELGVTGVKISGAHDAYYLGLRKSSANEELAKSEWSQKALFVFK